MNCRPLGRTGLKVSEIGFGAWAIGGNQHGNSYGPTDDGESIRAVHRALELGCNFFDTADVYGDGHSEEILGQALEGGRHNVVVATKVGGNFYDGRTRMDLSPQYIPLALDRSLQRLKTDVIDLYQLHNPPLEMVTEGGVFEPLIRLKKAGKIRFIGLSIFDPKEGLEAMKHGVVDTLQVAYNILSPAPARDLFPTAKKNGVGIIAREPLANGFLTGKFKGNEKFVPGDIRYNWPLNYIKARIQAAGNLRFLESNGRRTLTQAALRFVLANDAVSLAIPGTKTVKQVEENLGTLATNILTEQELGQIFELTADNFGL